MIFCLLLCHPLAQDKIFVRIKIVFATVNTNRIKKHDMETFGAKNIYKQKNYGGENGKFNKTNAWQELSVVHYKPPIIKTDTSQLDQGPPQTKWIFITRPHRILIETRQRLSRFIRNEFQINIQFANVWKAPHTKSSIRNHTQSFRQSGRKLSSAWNYWHSYQHYLNALFFSAANMPPPPYIHSSIPNKLLPFYVYELKLTSARVQKFFSRPETCLTTRCKRNTPLIWIDWFSCELRKLGAVHEQPQMGRNAVDEGKKKLSDILISQQIKSS